PACATEANSVVSAATDNTLHAKPPIIISGKTSYLKKYNCGKYVSLKYVTHSGAHGSWARLAQPVPPLISLAVLSERLSNLCALPRLQRKPRRFVHLMRRTQTERVRTIRRRCVRPYTRRWQRAGSASSPFTRGGQGLRRRGKIRVESLTPRQYLCVGGGQSHG